VTPMRRTSKLPRRGEPNKGVSDRTLKTEPREHYKGEAIMTTIMTTVQHHVVDPKTTSSHPVLLVDSHAHGISLGGTTSAAAEGVELVLHEGDRSPTRLRSRYVLNRGEPLADLERHLQKLSQQGELRRTTIIFGVGHDPFHPFDEKFAVSMRFLEIFERYVPGKLIIQTRSPLIVIGMPVLKRVRESTSILIGIETPHQDIAGRYTPHLPTVEERFKTVRALRRFGLHVGIQVGPILPYGDWRKDAAPFAKKLCDEADLLVVRSVVQMSERARPTSVVARMLAAERSFFWLRQDSHVPLTEAIKEIDHGKLYHPATLELEEPQLPLFPRQHG